MTAALGVALLACWAPQSSSASLPGTGNWSPGPYFSEARDFAAAAALPDGGVLLADGKNDIGQAVSTVDIYDPSTGVWGEGPPTIVSRDFAVGAALQNGDVLVAGGHKGGNYLATAETFDPATDSWTAAPSMLEAREGAAAATLVNGDVLVAGGESESEEYLASAELYDPTTKKWSAIAPMLQARERAVAVALSNGDVLVAGGEDENANEEEVKLETSEIYDPSTNTWTPAANMLIGREAPTAAILPNGDVLVAGGESENDGILGTSEIYDPMTNTWAPAAMMLQPREGASAVLLSDGAVLVAGGYDYPALNSSELFYSAPQAITTGGDFGVQAVAQPSPASTVLVTDIGAQPLSISRISLGGIDPGDFSITADACSGRRLAFGQSCAVALRFTPASTGAREASLSLLDNAPSASSIALTGTGVAPAATGPAGPAGPTGAAGPKGARGPAGTVELITCERVKHGKGFVQKCKTKLGSTPIKFTTDGLKIAAVLTRGKVTYATGFEIGPAGRTRLLVRPRRTLGKGRYTLTIKRGGTYRHQTITIG